MAAPKMTVGQKAAKSMTTVEHKLQSSPVFASLIIATFILFSAALILHFLASFQSLSGGLFSHSVSHTLEAFPLNITPPCWAFFIWVMIYIMQLMWVVYSLGLICCKIEQKRAYLSPVVLSPVYFIFFNVSTAFNMGWLFLWDRYFFWASFVFLICIALSLLLTMAIASSRLFVFRDTLVDQSRKSEVRFLQISVINGIGAYATWVIILSLINLGIILTYKWKHPITNEHSSVICLIILAFLTVIYMLLDFTVIECYNRYNVAPYVVVVWSLATSVSQRYYPSSMSSIFSVVLLGVVSLALVIKLGLTIYCSCTVHNQYRLMKMGRPGNRPL